MVPSFNDLPVAMYILREDDVVLMDDDDKPMVDYPYVLHANHVYIVVLVKISGCVSNRVQ